MMEEQKRQEELQALKRDIFESLHCALPGIVVSFDADSQTATIRPAVKRNKGHLAGRRQWRMQAEEMLNTSARYAGGGTTEPSPTLPLPLLRDVPVFMPVSFEIQEGDACLVIFADRDIDAWFETGEAEVPPSGRMHSLSDGFAFVGFRTRRNLNEDASDG